MLGMSVIIEIKTKKPYTLEELYEAIREVPFEAGPPSIVHYGFAHVICFPEQDLNNQVQIRIDKKGRIFVQKGVQAMGAQKVAENMALDQATGGMSGMSMLFGKKKKICEQLTRKTAEQIQALDL